MATLAELSRGEIKASPRNRYVGAFADALTAGRDFANRAQIPEAVPLVGGTKLGDLLLGQSPEEINNWSYGNAPMQVVGGGTGSLVPQTKTGRGQPLADALTSFSGVPGVGKVARKIPGAAIAAIEDVAAHAPGAYGQRGMIAWHGSPHKFDKFDMSKIGTGEGAQAYGHGLYLAESPEVANQYRVNLSYDPEKMKVGGKQINAVYDSLNRKAANMPAKDAAPIYDQMDMLERLMANDTFENVAEYAKGLHPDAQKWLHTQVKPTFETYGHTYKTDIPDEAVAKMLDWDKPFSEQHPAVQKALEGMDLSITDGMLIPGGGKLKIVDDPDFGKKYFLDYGDKEFRINENEVKNLVGTGSDGKSIVAQLTNKLGRKKAEDWLRSNGIPGIRYLDGGSRSTGAGSSNFVLFDDRMPRILERNGQPTGAQPWQSGEWQTLADMARQGQ